jgi:CubicO group peptidase (beta-lactamase class C family)
MQAFQVPGCAISIVKDGNIVAAKGYGTKSAQKILSDNAVDEKTVFPLASVTKLITCFTCGRLIDQKIVDWDDPIIHLFSGLKLSDPYAEQHLTIRDCLSMRSGLAGPEVDDLLYQGSPTREKLLDVLATIPFPHGFRSHFAYQNLSYIAAAKALENSKKLTWETIVQNELLSPLEMKNSFPNYTSSEKSTNRAIPHKNAQDTIIEVPYENLDFLAPAAGINSCAHDIARFLAVITKKETGETAPFIQDETVKTIFSPQTIARPENFAPGSESLFESSQFLTYGLGCFIHDYAGITICQTPGLTDGVSSVLLIIPTLHLGIFVVNNLESPVFTHKVAFHILDQYLHFEYLNSTLDISNAQVR